MTLCYWQLPLLGVIGLVCLAPALAAEPSLDEAVKALDAKYLVAPESGAIDDSPKIVAGGGEEGLAPLNEEFSLGALRVTLTYVEEKPQAATRGDIPAEAMLPGEVDLGQAVSRTPVVTVYFDDPSREPHAAGSPEAGAGGSDADQPGGQAGAAAPQVPAGPRVVAELRGPSAGVSDPPVSVQIAELDPGNAYPEVVVSFFTGGAHCCSLTKVLTSNAEGSEWTTIDVGEFDGGPMLGVDLDGDGTYEFETRDNAFLYAFACYACSQAPLQVLAVRNGKIKDVSADPRFTLAHAAWLKDMIVGVPDQDVNGFLAGYVGQKIRLGDGKQAWDLMLKYYDRNTDWGLEVCDTEPEKSADCPGNTVPVKFPEALERMLNKNGYRIGG